MPRLTLVFACLLLVACGAARSAAGSRHGLLVVLAIDARSGHPAPGARVRLVTERVDLRFADGQACDARGECEVPFDLDGSIPAGRVAWIGVEGDGYATERQAVSGADLERPPFEPRTFFFLLAPR